MKLISSLQKSGQQWFVVLGIGVLFLAILTRFYQLGMIPHGMTWDEAAIGYNGYAVITTRRDEWLQKLPISFQSFGDYKAPVAIYLTGILTTLLGAKLWVVRLPFAIAGVISVIAFGYLVFLLAADGVKKWQSLLGLLLMTIIPWHVHYSRVGFESGLALAMFLVGLVATIIMVQKFAQLKTSYKVSLLLLGVFAWAATVNTYHSAKIFVPLFVVWYGYHERRWLVNHWRWFAFGLMTGIITVIPLAYDSLFGSGATRAGVLITNQNYTAFTTIKVFAYNLVAHLSSQFLVFGHTDSLRHGSGSWGVLLPFTFGFVLMGLATNLIHLLQKKFHMSVLLKFGFAFVLIGLIPAALSSEMVPHSNRALFALPGFLLLSIEGLTKTIEMLAKFLKTGLSMRLVIGMFVLLEALCFTHYWHDYLTNFAKQSASDFQDGYLEAMQLAISYERGKDGLPPVDKILVSDEYGQPYIFTLFVRGTSPIAYRGGSLYKYEFTQKITSSDLTRPNTLVISTPSQYFDTDQATHLVYGSDDQPRFAIYYTGSYEN